MAIQYIGARYVPRFTGPYDNTQAYEALDVADNGLGTSYIAKIPVPAGTPLTNTTYWAIYGATSGAIINLQNQINNMNDGTVPGSLQNQINDLDSDIQNVSENAEKNILIIGNSYVDLGVANRLASNFDHVYKFTGSGIGFVSYSGHSDTFELQLDAAIADTSFENSSITDILFVSAMGDTRALTENPSNYNSQFAITLLSIKTKIDTYFTRCKRVSVSFAEIRAVPYFSDNKYSALFSIHRRFKDVLPMYNFAYLGWSGFNLLCDGNYTESDNYHPNNDGVFYIGGILKASYYGPIHYNRRATDANCPFNLFSGKTIAVVLEFTPDEVCINIRDASITSGSAASISAFTDLIDLTALPIPVPPRSDYAVNIHTDLINAGNGTILNDITVNVGGEDSNGMGRIVITHAVSLGSVIANSVSFKGLNLITYLI